MTVYIIVRKMWIVSRINASTFWIGGSYII